MSVAGLPQLTPRRHSYAGREGLYDDEMASSSEEVSQDDAMKNLSHFDQVLQERFQFLNRHAGSHLPQPLCFNSLNKISAGGSDILEYICVFGVLGNPEDLTCDHWLYVSMGLTDIYGLFNPKSNLGRSGLGFELTFRLKTSSFADGPPEWPAELMQKMARYVISAGTRIVDGDHITWHSPLHGGKLPIETNICHMLCAKDYSIPVFESSTGNVEHFQLVGVTSEEIEICQNWNGRALLKILSELPLLGGKGLVTDIARTQSLLDLYPSYGSLIDQGIQHDGSDLAGVRGSVIWVWTSIAMYMNYLACGLSAEDQEKYKHFLNLQTSGINVEYEIAETISKLESASLNDQSKGTQESRQIGISVHDKVMLIMSSETAKLLPLALRGRVKHGRSFVYHNTGTSEVVMFVSSQSSPKKTGKNRCYASYGCILEIEFVGEQIEVISEDITRVFQQPKSSDQRPKFLYWPQYKFAVALIDFQ